MAEPAHRDLVAAWEELRPAGEAPGYIVGHGEERSAYVNGLRGLADYLATHPEIPAPEGAEYISIFVAGSLEEKRAQVEYGGSLLQASIIDDTARGGHLYASRSFGPFTYQLIGISPRNPKFAVGQDVRLISEAAKAANSASRAHAGYVVSSEEEESARSYTVHFPGSAGTQPGWMECALKPASFRRLTLVQGEISSIKQAESALIMLNAETEFARSQGRKPESSGDDIRELSAALAGICGLKASELRQQMEPQVSLRVRDLRAAGRGSQPRTAANDGPQLPAGGTETGQPAAAMPVPAETPVPRRGSGPGM